MRWYERIVSAHLEVTQEVRHAQRIKSDRYFVWREDGRNDLNASNRHVERAVTGVTDLYTKIEFDPWGDQLGEALSSRGIAWSLVGVDYEEDTGFFHWSWDWEVCDGEDDY